MTEQELPDPMENVPRMDDWREESCLGFYGYADGRASAVPDEIPEPGRPRVLRSCADCTVHLVCAAQLVRKTYALIPSQFGAYMDMIREGLRGERLARCWSAEFTESEKMPDPISMIRMIHSTAGAQHQHEDDKQVEQDAEDYPDA